jgi:asparagine synthase (glutamine-hydrolysing)
MACRALGLPVAVAVVGRLEPGTTPTTIATAHHRHGTAGVQQTAGEWIIAIRTPERLTVWRDPAGGRTAYWARVGRHVVVATEPRAVHTIPTFDRRIRPGALAQYLTFSFVPGTSTMLEGLDEIPAGHRVEIDLDTHDVRLVRWYFHEAIEPADDDPDTWIGRTRAAVDAAVASRLPDREPVAVFLSGGLDSSIVASAVAARRRMLGGSAPISFSLHFGPRHPNELSFAHAVAQRAETQHHDIEVGPQRFEPLLRQMVWHLDDPIGDPVTIGNYVLAEAAAEHTDWVFNGEGGDPVFGGPKNLPMLLAHWYPTLHEPAQREARYIATWRRAGEEIFTLLHPDIRAEIDVDRDLIQVLRPYFTGDRPHHFLNKMMIANMRLKGAHLILPKVERMLGAHSLTPLSPLFDRNVIELSLQMPPQAKLQLGIEKWILKRAYADLLPREVVDRPKSGMRIPVDSWFRADLRRLARHLLSRRAVERAGILDHRRVHELRHYRTGRDGLRLWMLTTLELWRQTTLERRPLD